MRITFLGSGGAFCDHRVNYQNNAVIDTAEGPVLLDCGTTAVQSLRELSISPHDVHAVLITHLHADHASPETLAGVRYYTGPDRRPSFQRTRLLGPSDVIEPLMGSLVPFMDEYLVSESAFARGGATAILDPVIGGEHEIGGVRFRFFRVAHVSGSGVDKPAYGVEIDDGTRRVLWSGDTTLEPEWLARATAQSDVARVFHECTFAPKWGPPVHTHWEDLCAVPAHITERVTLMHHTRVPEDVDISCVAGAAERHQVFTFDE